MPASLGGKHKDRSRPKYTTQVTKQKSQYHTKEEAEVNEISDRLAKRAINKAHGGDLEVPILVEIKSYLVKGRIKETI